MTCVVVTTTWNSIDVIELFLEHYRRLGFHQALVMDFNSTDGTAEVLASLGWRAFVNLVSFPGLASLDSSNVMLPVARERYGQDCWCLFCDPDELLATPAMSIHDALVDDVQAVSVPRFNMTAPRSIAYNNPAGLSARQSLTLRIDRRHPRSIGETVPTGALDPPWIFTAIQGKVLMRPEATVSIGEGDHTVLAASHGTAAAPPGVYLLHYPFRGYATFRNKIELAERGFDASPHLSQSHGWQVRRWITLSHSGGLYEEFLQQFIPDGDVARLLHDGTVFRDDSVAAFHRVRSDRHSRN